MQGEQAAARTRHVRDGSVRLLERLNASKLSLCVIRHVRRTGGRVLRWLAAISHTALIVFILVVLPVLPRAAFPPFHSRVVPLARGQVCLIPSLVALPIPLSRTRSHTHTLAFPPPLSLSLYLYAVCISHDTLLASALLQASLLLSFSLSLSLHCS